MGSAPADLEHRGVGADDPLRRYAERLRADPGSVMHELPLMSERLRYLQDWVAGGRGNRYWTPISPIDAAQTITAPALHVTGTNDTFGDGSLSMFSAMSDRGVEARAQNAQFLVLGPWSHANMGEWQRRTPLGADASASAYDLSATQLEFFTAV